MLLTSLCKKPTLSAYDVLQGEVGYFSAPKSTAKVIASSAAKKLTWKNVPQTVDALVSRLQSDLSRVESMTDPVGQQITRDNIAALTAFLAANNINI